jgi:hypothetical protein
MATGSAGEPQVNSTLENTEVPPAQPVVCLALEAEEVRTLRPAQQAGEPFIRRCTPLVPKLRFGMP